MTSILKADNIQDADGNNIINESGNTITIGASGDTISIPSGATIANSGTATGFGEANTPHFKAFNNAAFTFSQNTTTIMRMNTVAFESNSGSFSTSNYNFTVPSGEGGKYFLTASMRLNGTTNNYACIYFFVDGTETVFANIEARDDYNVDTIITGSGMVNLSAGAVVDCRVYYTHSSPQLEGGSYSYGRYSYFSGFKISST